VWRASFTDEDTARKALYGVGNRLREWVKTMPGSERIIVCRRTTRAETEALGGVRDLRGLPEALERLLAVAQAVPGLGFEYLSSLEPELMGEEGGATGE